MRVVREQHSMIKLRKSKEDELESFVKMEQQSHAKEFINGTDLVTHQRNFKEPNIVYLSIANHNGDLAGYFILALASTLKEVEFRRILIDQHHRGIGQMAITKMEIYCREELGSKRIWLDVYEDNVKGKHIYEKLGYKRFREEIYNGRKLLYYQKAL